MTKKYATLRCKAAHLLETRGWIRGAYSEEGKHCLVGALCAANGTSNYVREGSAVMKALKAMGFENDDVAIEWNDRRRRRPHEVLARLRKGL